LGHEKSFINKKAAKMTGVTTRRLPAATPTNLPKLPSDATSKLPIA